ncbi:MAG: hypothetical protein J5878_04115 [Oscillospiraceae bacterium]|nr:hypothetical protein [Oscillospiraceae bacterium]
MKKSSKFLTLLGSFFAAVLLWLYVVTLVAPEASFTISNISIGIDGKIVLEERGLIITDQSRNTLSLDLRTSRVNKQKLNADSLRVYVDVSKIREAGTYPLSCIVTLPDTVRSSDVEILRKSVDSVNVTVSALKKKRIKIQPKWDGSVKDGYLFEAQSVTIEPAEIELDGPDYEIEKIDRAVVSYNVSALEQTEIVKDIPVTFLDKDGNELHFSENTSANATKVNLTLPVLRTKQIQLDVELQEGGGVGKDNVTLQLNPASIWVKGAADVIEKLSDTFILGQLDLSTVSNHEERSFPLLLQEGVANVSGETEVLVSIELKGVSSGTIPVSTIHLINVPAGYRAEASTRTVNINVRGSTEEINALKEDKNNGIYIKVDLSDYNQTGAFTVHGEIVNPNYPTISMGNSVEIGVIISTGELTPED